jgi:putative ABC transport system substrate-binding protein
MNRREFIAWIGSSAAWPVVGRAQPAERMRRIGILGGAIVGDTNLHALLAVFRQRLQELGWTEGSNLRFDDRWAGGDRALIRKQAAELVALKPDVILAIGSGAVGPLQQITRTVPIVFTGSVDPVGGGIVASLARPGGNITGFAMFEYGLAGKWPELLKRIAPATTRVAVLRDPAQFAAGGQLGAVQAVAPFFAIEVTPLDVRDADGIERAVTEFAQRPNGALIVVGGYLPVIHRHTIIALAARHRLPTIYFDRLFVDSGGLVSYGSKTSDVYVRAASYVDRILKGEKPADLPVQAPTKYELVLNMKTAKALGVEVPPGLLALADEVIE